MVRADEPEPLIATRIRANVFWMSQAPLARGRRYVLRMGAARVAAELESVLSVLDASGARVGHRRRRRSSGTTSPR